MISNETAGVAPSKTPAKPAVKAPAKTAAKPVAPRGVSGNVLGRYGQTTGASRIYASPNVRSKVYYTAKPFEYICVNWTNYSAWLKVKMSNGIQGYIASDTVAVLPYLVVAQTPTRVASGNGRIMGSATSRAGAARTGLQYIGTPYVWGGNDIQNGIDCSGFVKVLYGEIGVDLPRTAAEQAKVGVPITRLQDLQPGDRLYFWETKRNKIGHTGLYLGNGYFVHSSSGHRGVATDYLSERWRKILVAARR